MKVSQKLSVNEVYNIILNNILSLENEIIDLKEFRLKKYTLKLIILLLINPLWTDTDITITEIINLKYWTI